MRIPAVPGTLRVTCPACRSVFEHGPASPFSGRAGFGWPGGVRSVRDVRNLVLRAVDAFAAWPVRNKMALYLVLTALVITLWIRGGREDFARAGGGRENAWAGNSARPEKPYLLEDPAFVQLLVQDAARRR